MDNYMIYLKDFSEYALKSEAQKAASTIVIRTYDDHGSQDTRRNSSPEEKEILTNVIYGALMTMKDSAGNTNTAIQDGALATAEYIGDFMIPKMNGYLSVYNPICQILKDFETVYNKARETQSEDYFNGYNIDRAPSPTKEDDNTWWIHRNGKTVGYNDGSIQNVKNDIGSRYYVSADDIRREADEAAEREEEGLSDYEKGIGFDDNIEQETIGSSASYGRK